MALPRVKICCIRDIGEAELAIAAGASALGLVAAMPSGPGVISEDAITTIAARIPPPIATFFGGAIILGAVLWHTAIDVNRSRPPHCA